MGDRAAAVGPSPGRSGRRSCRWPRAVCDRARRQLGSTRQQSRPGALGKVGRPRIRPRRRPAVRVLVRPDLGEQQPNVQAKRIGTPESIRREIEQSLRRLGINCIDLYQIIGRRKTEAVKVLATLLDLKQEGKTAPSACPITVDLIERAERRPRRHAPAAVFPDQARRARPKYRGAAQDRRDLQPGTAGLLTGSTRKRARP